MSRRATRHNPFIFPSGVKAGLKKDKPSKIADRCNPISKAAGYVEIDEAHWDELADTRWHVQKDSYYRYTSNQNGLGSCAADSEHNTAAACDACQNLPLVLHNPLFAYRVTSGGVDRGSVIGENLEYGREYGRCPEEIWPRSKGFKATPSDLAFKVAKFFRLREFFYLERKRQIPSALLQGWFVHAGYNGHAVSFARYLKKGLLWFKNSWGDWGQNGFGELPLNAIVEDYGMYAYKDTYSYWDPVKGWGMWDEAGNWTPCPWEPQKNQAALSVAVNAYQEAQTRLLATGKKVLIGNAAEALYRQQMERVGLAV